MQSAIPDVLIRKMVNLRTFLFTLQVRLQVYFDEYCIKVKLVLKQKEAVKNQNISFGFLQPTFKPKVMKQNYFL